MTHLIRIAASGQEFECAEGQTILDAALRAGIQMPYSCRKGVCGNCAGGVASGEVRCSPAASADATPPGQVLYCQCTPLSALEIVPTAWSRGAPDARTRLTVKVFRNTRAAPDVSLLQLRLAAGKRARFKAGQYLQVLLPDGSRRSYSMANAPHESDTLQLHIRHLPGGQFTQIVPQLQPGDTLEVELPYGHFALREDSDAPMLCVAGGTGFAPLKSLLDDMARRRIARPVTLVWGARDTAGLYLPQAVERWQSALPGFRYVACVEDAADAVALGAFHGRADAAVLDRIESLSGWQVYACGAPPMISALRQACVHARGLDPAHFYSDVFVPGPAVA